MLAAVTMVLERAGQPMRAREIHRAAQELVGEQLHWSSVRGILSGYTIGSDKRFRRVARGSYVLIR